MLDCINYEKITYNIFKRVYVKNFYFYNKKNILIKLYNLISVIIIIYLIIYISYILFFNIFIYYLYLLSSLEKTLI